MKGTTPYSSIIQKYIDDDNDNKHKQNSNISSPWRNNNGGRRIVTGDQPPIFGTSSLINNSTNDGHTNKTGGHQRQLESTTDRASSDVTQQRLPHGIVARLLLISCIAFLSKYLVKVTVIPRVRSLREWSASSSSSFSSFSSSTKSSGNRPEFTNAHPYITSSYYSATRKISTLQQMYTQQVVPNNERLSDTERGITSRLAILRPFCEFDAEALPTTFACWNSLVPCRAAEMDLGDTDDDDDDDDTDDVNKEDEGDWGEWVIFNETMTDGNGRQLFDEDTWECDTDTPLTDIRDGSDDGTKRCRRRRQRRRLTSRENFDDVPADGLRTTSADLFLFYSQAYSDNKDAINAVDMIMEEFFSPGGWSRCFDNIYAVEANIPKELDLYIPAAQQELYNWVNGPNRQYEAGFRIIQSGEWGKYDAFYLMEGDSVPVKNYWLDVILGEVNAHRPFAVLGAQYDGDKWDAFYESIPISLLHHTNGNGIYNVSHPLLERLTGQLEVEAPCPYNSIPYDYRMSQMWTEGMLGIVPKLAPKIMLNEEGVNITLSDNLAMFSKWANRWKDEEPYKYTSAIHNYAATNLIPRHLGPEYVIHGAKLYSPWDPSRTEITLVVSDWFFDRSLSLVKNLDSKDHPFSKVVVMIPPSVSNSHDYTRYTSVPVTRQFRDMPDFMDLCAADITTEWFMITNSYHQVSRHVDLMFTPGKFVPVIPFTPATYPFCLKYPYCKEIILLSQRWNKKNKQVVLDMDMLYNTKERNAFCSEWMERNGVNGEDLYAKHEPLRWKLRNEKIIGPKGPTGTDYIAWLTREKKDGMYKMTDRSLYGARSPFIKVFRKEEKLDGMSEDEKERRLGMTLLSNTTECSCDRHQTEDECLGSGLGCQWRPLFESCHPPEMIDDGVPICSTSEAPTMSPTISIDGELQATEEPTIIESTVLNDTEANSTWNVLNYLFKSREHEAGGSGSEYIDVPPARRHLLVSSDVESATVLNGYDPTSVSDNMNSAASFLESLSRGEVVSPTQSTFQGAIKLSCPTYGPSIVPRRIEEIDVSVGDSRKLLNATTNIPKGIPHNTHLTAGRARHAQHQLVQFDPTKSLDAGSVKVPSPDEAKKRRTLVEYGDNRIPLHIMFDTSSLSTLLRNLGQDFSAIDQYYPSESRITAYTESILPSITRTWGSLLNVNMPLQNLHPQSSSCGTTTVPQQHINEGVVDANVIIYVETRNPSSCSLDTRPEISICSFDQHMRPLVGSLTICLEELDVQNNKVHEKEVLYHTARLSQLLGRFLGLTPALFQYFRDETGLLWGERRVEISCGEEKVAHEIMMSNLIQQRKIPDEEPFYEITSPIVKQVVRNHFDCQTLTGARLVGPSPNPNNDDECNFFNLDLRYHFDEDMTSISTNADGAFIVSPLSLALLEDSSWYKANFTMATTPSFGRGAGCGFVESACIVGGNVPDYSKGFFCNSVDLPGTRSGCDYSHHHKAGCDLDVDASPPESNRYFLPSNPEFGSVFADTLNCPMRSRHLAPCASNGKAVTSLFGESFGENSRCFETDVSVPVCLETVCNPVDKTLGIFVNGRHFYCSYDGQVINVDAGYSVVCPRIAVVCPDLVCPSNCSGKGVCDYCLEIPQCICDDPFDLSPGCFGEMQYLVSGFKDEGSVQEQASVEMN